MDSLISESSRAAIIARSFADSVFGVPVIWIRRWLLRVPTPNAPHPFLRIIVDAAEVIGMLSARFLLCHSAPSRAATVCRKRTNGDGQKAICPEYWPEVCEIIG